MSALPSLSPPPKKVREPRTYRIGVYGLSVSGKTCLLVALQQGGGNHAAGLTCTYVPAPPAYRPPQAPLGDETSEDCNVQLHLGRKWLDAAASRLAAGLTPSGNKVDNIYRYVFDFSFPDTPVRRVELIDYAGELVKDSVTPGTLAARLKEHMKELDGLLVLAATPHLGEEAVPLVLELTLLRQAFAELRGEMSLTNQVTCPVALAFTKWDRHTGLAIPTAAGLLPQVGEWLSLHGTAPLKGLHDELANSVPQPAAEGQAPYFRAFALSALGPCEQVDVPDPADPALRKQIERPRQFSPLLSFGVLAPFAWLLQQRDAQELEEMEQALRGPQALLCWPPVLWWRASQCHRRHRRYHRRQPARQQTQRLFWKALVLSAIQLVVLGVVILLLELVWDGGRHWNARAVTADEVNLAAWPGAERWYRQYSSSFDWYPRVYPWFFSRGAALQELQAVEERRDAVLWQPVQARGPNKVEQWGPAQKYLDFFEELDIRGKHSDEAKLIVQEAPLEQQWHEIVKAAPGQQQGMIRTALQDQEFDRSRYGRCARELLRELECKEGEARNQGKLLHVKAWVKTLLARGGNAEESEWAEVEKQLGKLPLHPEAENDQQRRDRLELLKQAGDGKIQTVTDREERKRREEWQKVKNAYEDAVANREFSKAAQLLRKATDGPELREVKKQFPKQIATGLQGAVHRELQPGNFDTARKLAERLQADPDVLSLTSTPEVDQCCKEQLQKINEEEEKHYYRKATAPESNLPEVNAYLDAIARQKGNPVPGREERREYILQLQRHLQEVGGQLRLKELSLVVREIRWKQYMTAADNQLRVTIDGTRKLDEQVKSVNGDGLSVSGYKIILKDVDLTKAYKLRVEVYREGGWVRYGANCISDEVSLSPLAMEGKKLALRDPYPYEVEVTLGIDGLPRRPPLPAWEKTR